MDDVPTVDRLGRSIDRLAHSEPREEPLPAKDHSKLYCLFLAAFFAFLGIAWGNYELSRLDEIAGFLFVEVICWGLVAYLLYIARDAYNDPPAPKVVQRSKFGNAGSTTAADNPRRTTITYWDFIKEFEPLEKDPLEQFQLDQDIYLIPKDPFDFHDFKL